MHPDWPSVRLGMLMLWERLPMFAVAFSFAARVAPIWDGQFDATATSPDTRQAWAVVWLVAAMSALTAALRSRRSRWRLWSGVIAVLVLTVWPLGIAGTEPAGLAITSAFFGFASLIAWSWGRIE